jgi:hypothetical protein
MIVISDVSHKSFQEHVDNLLTILWSRVVDQSNQLHQETTTNSNKCEKIWSHENYCVCQTNQKMMSPVSLYIHKHREFNKPNTANQSTNKYLFIEYHKTTEHSTKTSPTAPQKHKIRARNIQKKYEDIQVYTAICTNFLTAYTQLKFETHNHLVVPLKAVTT